MKAETQQDRDIANPPFLLKNLVRDTKVGKIVMAFSKIESSLSTMLDDYGSSTLLYCS